MNCTQFRQQLDDFADGELNPAQRSAMQGHAAECEPCRSRLERESQIQDALRALPVEPASPGFAARALRGARAAHRRPAPQGAFAAGFATAAAVAVVVWGLAGRPAGTPMQGEPQIRLAMAQEQKVNLVFNVPEDIRGAQLAMALPANVELEGYPNQRQLSWHTDLSKGQNVLTLPLRAVKAARGELVARLSYGGKEKRFRIRLEVNGSNVLQGPSPSGWAPRVKV